MTKKKQMLPDYWVNDLTKDEICLLYKFVCEYEENIKDYPRSFDISTKELERLIRDNDLYLDTYAQKNFSKAYKHSSHILFEQYVRSKVSKDDKAHHLMRHIRNAIAHGNIKRLSGDLISLKDHNGKRYTMDGKISIKLLFQLIESLVNSNKNKR